MFVILGLAIAVLAVFWQVHSFEFVQYDDDRYVSNNKHILSGLRVENVIWVFTSVHGGNWHPITGLSHILDCQLFGPNAGRHHLVNLLIHIINTLLIFVIFRQMTGALWASAFVAACFGLHPLHVESVAWISERKDVLSTLFWLLTIAAYFRYVKMPSIGRYLLTLMFFALGLMAKPMVVTLPFVLLLLDYWPLGRLELFGTDKSNNRKKPFAIDKWKNFWKLVLEKVPFFVLSAIFCAITIFVQSGTGAVKDTEQFSLSVRMANAVVSYGRYIGKMIWPAELAFFYPHPHEKIIYWQLFGVFILLVVLTFLVMRESARHKYLLTGWFWYLGTLVPVIGLVQVGGQSMADRYTYIPFVGLFIVVAWGTNELLAKWRYKKPVLLLSSLAVILILAVLARWQVGYWRDSMSLFEHAIRVTEGNYVAYDGRGLVYKRKGQYSLAVSDFKKALAANPRYAAAYGNLGLVCNSTGQYDMAISCYNKAIEINPKKALAYNNRGNAYSGKGRLDLAISDYNKAVEIDPELAEAYYNRGNAYMDKGKGQLDLAIADYDKSIEINPRDAVAYNNRGLAYMSKGDFDHAISDYNKSVEIDPKYAIAYNNRANAYKSNGQFDRAIPDYNKALEINPKLVGAYVNKAGACEKAGRTREAIEAYKAFIQYAPAQHHSLVEQAGQKIKELEQQVINH